MRRADTLACGWGDMVAGVVPFPFRFERVAGCGGAGAVERAGRGVVVRGATPGHDARTQTSAHMQYACENIEKIPKQAGKRNNI